MELISKELFDEIGFDAPDLIKTFSQLKEPIRSLNSSLDEDSTLYLKSKYNFEGNTKKEIITELLTKKPELAQLCFIFSRIKEKFNDEIINNLYRKETNSSESSKVLLLLKSILEYGEKDILRKVHYHSILVEKNLVYCNWSGSDISEMQLNGIDRQGAENFARNALKLKQRKNLLLWYLLPIDNDIVLFFYKKAKSRAKLPRPSRKGHSYIDYSKPMIILFDKGGKRIGVTSSSIEQSINMAKEIMKNTFFKNSPTTVEYCTEEKLTDIENLSLLLNNLIREQNSEERIQLREVKYVPLEENHDAYLTLTKRRDNLITIIEKVEEAFNSQVAADKVVTIGMIYNNKKFELNIVPQQDQENKAYVVCSYKGKGHLEDYRELCKYLETKYNINIARKRK